MKKSIILFSLFFSMGIMAQITSIPDPGFEQALIDLGIDSDQTINGQVLTSDVASVTSLDLSIYNQLGIMQKITGIEDFTSLKVLKIIQIGLLYHNEPLDLSGLTNLEELYLGDEGDVEPNEISKIILNNNPNLMLIDGYAETVTLTGTDVDINNLDLYLGFLDGWSGQIAYVCVEVTNPTDATNGQGTYSNWDIGPYVNFSSDCNLGTSSSTLITAELYPNPVTEQFQIQTSDEIKEVSLYSLIGKEVAKFNSQKDYNISHLSAGIYFVHIFTTEGFATQKLIKN